MGKMQIDGEDVEDLGLVLVEDEDGADAEDDGELVEEIEPVDDPQEVVLVSPVHVEESSDHGVTDDKEEDLLSQLESILAPLAQPDGDDVEAAAPVSAKVKGGKKVEDDDEDDTLGAIRPRRKDEVHCGRCYILVKASALKCPVGDDACPVVPAGQ